MYSAIVRVFILAVLEMSRPKGGASKTMLFDRTWLMLGDTKASSEPARVKNRGGNSYELLKA